jgi:glycosyltransferase involved in cell wall biosynthesis
MKVLHVAATRNSESSAAWRILSAQREFGIDATALVHEDKYRQNNTEIFSSNWAFSKYRFALRKNSMLGKISHFNKPNLPWSYNYHPAANWSDISSHEFDLINLHWIPSVIDLNNLEKLRKPVIITLHDVWPITGGCHCNLQCGKWENDCGDCPQLQTHLPRSLSAKTNLQRKRDSFSKIEILGVAAPSNWIAQMAKRSPLFVGRKVKVVPNCVDSRIFHPANRNESKVRLGLEPSKFHLLFVVSGEVTQFHKGFDLLQRVMKEISERPISRQLELLVVGKSTDTQDLGFLGKVHYLGEVDSQEKMKSIYCAADVAISTSRQDNLPNTLLEATACGIPAVAFDIGGISDIISPGVNGSLIRMGDIKGMADAIENLRTEPGTSTEIAEYTQSKFSVFESASRYLDFYSELLGY